MFEKWLSDKVGLANGYKCTHSCLHDSEYQKQEFSILTPLSYCCDRRHWTRASQCQGGLIGSAILDIWAIGMD